MTDLSKRPAMNNVKCHAEFISASPDPETSSGWHIASLDLSFVSFSLYQDKENEELLISLLFLICSLPRYKEPKFKAVQNFLKISHFT